MYQVSGHFKVVKQRKCASCPNVPTPKNMFLVKTLTSHIWAGQQDIQWCIYYLLACGLLASVSWVVSLKTSYQIRSKSFLFYLELLQPNEFVLVWDKKQCVSSILNEGY